MNEPNLLVSNRMRGGWAWRVAELALNISAAKFKVHYGVEPITLHVAGIESSAGCLQILVLCDKLSNFFLDTLFELVACMPQLVVRLDSCNKPRATE